MDTRKSVDRVVLSIILPLVILLITSKLAQSLKLDPDGKPYDRTVDKLCGQFAADRDNHLYMQGLSHGYDEQFYLVYHDHVYNWNNDDNFKSHEIVTLWSTRLQDYYTKKYIDIVKPLGVWNEIAWIKSILNANGIDGSGVKLTRLWIDTSVASGPKRTQIEISFQASGQAQVDTLIGTNETGTTELRKDYVPECMVSNKNVGLGLTYIFRYDHKQRVVVMVRRQSYTNNLLKEEGPFYMHRETRGYRVYLKFYPSPPDHYTPLLTQLPIYGFISNVNVHLWDLPNHLVYYFDFPNSQMTDSHNELGNLSFEQYFGCQTESPSSSPPVAPTGAPSNYPEESESTPKDGQTSTSAQTQTGGPPLEDESNPQVVPWTTLTPENNQSNGLLYFALTLGLIVLLLGPIIWIIARRIIKRKRKKKKRSHNKSKKMKKSAGIGSSKVASTSKSSISFSSSSSTNKTNKTASSAFTSSTALKAKVTAKTDHIRVSE